MPLAVSGFNPGWKMCQFEIQLDSQMPSYLGCYPYLLNQ